MNKYIKLLTGLVVTGTLWSCSKDSEPEPWLQSWPVITLEGDEVEYAEIGSDYTLPGFKATNTITGQDASDRVIVSIYDNINSRYVDDISTASAGMYTVYYDAVASEVTTDPGVSKTRSVFVYNPQVTTDIAGDYSVDVNASYHYRISSGENKTFAEVASDNKNDISEGINVSISQIAPSLYEINDLLGGLVEYVYGYSPNNPSFNFKDHAYLYLDTENNITLLTASFGYTPWNGNYNVTSLTDAEYDPQTGSISYKATINGFILTIVLN